jgi:hypothetical protein
MVLKSTKPTDYKVCTELRQNTEVCSGIEAGVADILGAEDSSQLGLLLRSA